MQRSPNIVIVQNAAGTWTCSYVGDDPIATDKAFKEAVGLKLKFLKPQHTKAEDSGAVERLRLAAEEQKRNELKAQADAAQKAHQEAEAHAAKAAAHSEKMKDLAAKAAVGQKKHAK